MRTQKISQYVCDLFCSMHHINFINFYRFFCLHYGFWYSKVKQLNRKEERRKEREKKREEERRKGKKREEKGRKKKRKKREEKEKEEKEEERRKASVNGWQGGG